MLSAGETIGYQQRVRQGIRLPSGRVIAIGRLMLASLFMLSLWLDVSQPARPAAYALLATYVILSAGILVAVWKNWWLDAQLAGPAHSMDIVLFAFLVFATQGYASPFFTFVMFLLISAAIRWGWRATTLTAVLVTLLFLLAGLLVARSTAELELQPFVIRTGHLVVLSLILIWFGINQWRTAVYPREALLADPSLDESPLETSLRAVMSGLRARKGAFVWREHGSGEGQILIARNGDLSIIRAPETAIASPVAIPVLYDLARDRALTRDPDRNLRIFSHGPLFQPELVAALGLSEGIAIPVKTGAGEGEIILQDLNLSTDSIDQGAQIANDVAAHIQRHALLKAAEESAEARSRLSLARDLHDSVVQFLAGAAIRLEAMKRSEAAGRPLEPELNELKQLVLQEQGELRSFIEALRSGSRISLAELAADLAALADRLSRQWDVDCHVSADPGELMIPARLHLDAHQLVREAVANAVRHASAKSVQVNLGAESDELRIEFINDGTRFPGATMAAELPRSIKERVEQAGGRLELARGMNVTKVSVALPINGRSR
jgi:signal transduction histidine kinase